MNSQNFDPDFYTFIVPCAEEVHAETIREMLFSGFEQDWSTTMKKDTDECLVDVDPSPLADSKWLPTDRAIEQFSSSSDGSMTIFTDNTDFLLVKDSLDDYGHPDIDGFALSWNRLHFWDVLYQDEDGTDILEEVIDSVTHVYEHLPSPFAFSQLPYQHEHETTVTQHHLKKPQLPDVYWLMILSPPICEDIGRGRLESAPVWRVDTLSDGSIRLVASGDGFKYRREDKLWLQYHLGLVDTVNEDIAALLQRERSLEWTIRYFDERDIPTKKLRHDLEDIKDINRTIKEDLGKTYEKRLRERFKTLYQRYPHIVLDVFEFEPVPLETTNDIDKRDELQLLFDELNFHNEEYAEAIQMLDIALKRKFRDNENLVKELDLAKPFKPSHYWWRHPDQVLSEE